jgi:hypothetical protein
VIKSCLLAVCLSLLSASAAFAQQKTAAPLPLQSAGNDSGLVVTLNLVQDDVDALPAVNYVAAVHDNIRSQDLASSTIKEQMPVAAANSHSVKNNLPPTLTVKTNTLLELHAMRQNAVDLCIQLPTKYRTRLPQCAEIFKHEIRLETFAKENH